jgi:drug/metabolite transporter (DMT)-like permease
MARAKRRRKNAGPPPVRNPRHEAKLAEPEAAPSRRTASGRTARTAATGEPQPLPFRGVIIRALVAALIFFVYILLVSDLSAASAFPITALAFVLMVPVGFLMDRAVYRIRLRRWQRQRGGA